MSEKESSSFTSRRELPQSRNPVRESFHSIIELLESFHSARGSNQSGIKVKALKSDYNTLSSLVSSPLHDKGPTLPTPQRSRQSSLTPEASESTKPGTLKYSTKDQSNSFHFKHTEESEPEFRSSEPELSTGVQVSPEASDFETFPEAASELIKPPSPKSSNQKKQRKEESVHFSPKENSNKSVYKESHEGVTIIDVSSVPSTSYRKTGVELTLLEGFRNSEITNSKGSVKIANMDKKSNLSQKQSMNKSQSKSKTQSMTQINGDVLTKIKEAEQKAADTTLLIEKLRNSIIKISEKPDITEGDNILLKQKRNQLLEKLNEFEDLTKNVQKMCGLPEVHSSQISTILEEHLKGKKETKQQEICNSFATFNENKLPKVIVCGSGWGNNIPRIIICEPTKGAKGGAGRPVFQQYPGRPVNRTDDAYLGATSRAYPHTTSYLAQHYSPQLYQPYRFN